MQEYNVKQLWRTKEPIIVFFTTIVAGLSSAFYLYFADKYSLLFYGDAISHLIGARKIIDWADPSLLQLGTVWLPLPHLMLLPFSLIDSLFFSGFAGLAVSLPCHAITATLIFKIIRNHVGSSSIGVVGALLYGLNPSILYLGITAMTEAPFMLFFVGFIYYLQKWHTASNSRRFSAKYLLLPSVFIVLATLCRYEAWLVSLVFVLFVFVVVIKSKEKINKPKIASLSLVALLGICIWLGYNFLIFNDPLEFANAEFYAASSQALERTNRDNLFMQPWNVISIYGMTTLAMFGPILLSLAVIGFIVHLQKKETKGTRSYLYAFLSLSPIFTILSMVLGVGEMTQWWFNSRFVVFLSPLVLLLASFFLASIFSKKKQIVNVSIMGGLAAVYIAIAMLGVVTYLDAEGGYLYKQTPFALETGEVLASKYDEGSIMIMTGSMQAHKIMIASGIPLRQYDDIIESKMWKPSFKEPWLYDQWIIIGKEPDSDSENAVNYWMDKTDTLNRHYSIIFENQYYKIMKLNSS